MTTIHLPWTKPPLTGNRTRGNPYARAAEVKQAKADAAWAIKCARVRKPTGPVEVTLHYRPATRRRRDADGMFPTLKATLDALVTYGVLKDDGWQHVPAVTCRIHLPTAEPAAMWMTLDEITEYQP